MESAAAGNTPDVRTPAEIRRDLEELTARRSALWHEESEGERRQAEIEALSAQIDRLWSELREARVTMRHGRREEIIRRARSEERINRDLDRQARRTRQGRRSPARSGRATR